MSKRMPTCSFKPTLHAAYEAIKAESEPWILSFIAPPTSQAAQYCRDCLFPFLCSLAYVQCPVDRVVWITKMMTWVLVSDDGDDDPSVRGCVPDGGVQWRHNLILACLSGSKPPAIDQQYSCPVPIRDDSMLLTKGMPALSEIWNGISNDMSPAMRSRFRHAMEDYLRGIRAQSRYRKAGCRLPGISEYVTVIRRRTVCVRPCLILLEYGLGIELDAERLSSALMARLHDAVCDHIALYNDMVSFAVEIRGGDFFNLPSVILQERRAVQAGFTFAEAEEEGLGMVEQADKLCVQLIAQAREHPGLIKKPGVEAYLRGLGFCMAGLAEWSLKTVRYRLE